MSGGLVVDVWWIDSGLLVDSQLWWIASRLLVDGCPVDWWWNTGGCPVDCWWIAGGCPVDWWWILNYGGCASVRLCCGYDSTKTVVFSYAYSIENH